MFLERRARQLLPAYGLQKLTRPPPVESLATILCFSVLTGGGASPFRAFQALTEDEDACGCLRAVRDHLMPNGRVIVNVFRPHAILDQSWCHPARVTWEGVDPQTGRRVVKKNRGERIDTERQLIYPVLSHEIEEDDGTVTILEDPLILRYYYREQLSARLAEAGFRVTEEYGWYDKTPIATGRELIMVANWKEDVP